MYDTFRNCKIYFEKQTKKAPFRRKGPYQWQIRKKGKLFKTGMPSFGHPLQQDRTDSNAWHKYFLELTSLNSKMERSHAQISVGNIWRIRTLNKAVSRSQVQPQITGYI